MAEEPPGNWELQRTLNRLASDLKDGMDGLNRRLDSMVSVGVHEAQLGRVDDRLKELADDIAVERGARKDEQNAERAEREKAMQALAKQMDKTVAIMRWLAASIVLPVVLFIAAIVFNVGGPTP